jgi:hypothetical protein
MSQITSKQLKKHWETRKQHGGYAGSFRDMLKEEAERADTNAEYRALGSTYADAAWLLLQRKP